MQIKLQIEKYDLILKKQLDEKLKKLKKVIWDKCQKNELAIKKVQLKLPFSPPKPKENNN